MTEQEWGDQCNEVKSAMTEYVARFTTPISLCEEYGHGVAWGTGNYIHAGERSYLLTNAHIFTDCKAGNTLAHLPGPTDDYIALVGNPTLKGWPFDIGLLEISNLHRPENGQIPVTSFDGEFAPVDGELVFWMGYPGYNINRNERPTEGTLRMTRLGSPLDIPGQPFLSQLVSNQDQQLKDYDTDKHVLVHYPAMANKDVSGVLCHTKHPKGMSGSLLWDTKYLSCMRKGKLWSHDEARVCGLIWGALEHPEEVVIATKIEHVILGAT